MSNLYQQPIQDINIKEYRDLITPYYLREILPLDEKAQNTVMQSREEIRNILKGSDERLIIVVGPCSIHDTQAAIEYACRLKDLRERCEDKLYIIMRSYFEKPRTNSSHWRGLIYDPCLTGEENINKGLLIARKFLIYLANIGIPSATEFVDTIIPQHYADTISLATIGARTVESQLHRQLASGLSMPVGFKNSTSGNIQSAINAALSARENLWFPGIDEYGRASIILTKGNPYTFIILRGGDNGPNYDRFSVEKSLDMLRKAGLDEKIMIDCSHGNSNKDFRKQPQVFEEVLKQRVEGNKGIMGVMLESNIREGNQKERGNLEYGVSITDGCIGWETTEQLILEAYRML